jgi:short-subunit dehydrogenase
LAEEVRGQGVTISCLCPGPTATEFGDVANVKFTMPFKYASGTAEWVARVGHAGYRRGKVVVIPGLMNRMAALSSRFMPRALVRRVTGSLQRQR